MHAKCSLMYGMCSVGAHTSENFPERPLGKTARSKRFHRCMCVMDSPALPVLQSADELARYRNRDDDVMSYACMSRNFLLMTISTD